MTSSKTFYLIRHGLATHSKRGYGKRKLTASILPESVPSIQRIAEFLSKVPESYNVSSEIIRCKETSAIINKDTGKKFFFDARLNEDYHETVGQIRDRVLLFLQDIVLCPEDNIIICTHGVIIAAIQNLIINNKFVTSQLTDYCLPGELIIVTNQKARIINFN